VFLFLQEFIDNKDTGRISIGHWKRIWGRYAYCYKGRKTHSVSIPI